MPKAKKKTVSSKKVPAAKMAKAPSKVKKAKGRTSLPSKKKAPTPIKPVTLSEARKIANVSKPRVVRAMVAAKTGTKSPEPQVESLAIAKEQADKKHFEEVTRRIEEFKSTMNVMKTHGVKGLSTSGSVKGPSKRRGLGASVAATSPTPLQILAEGDSWFDYPRFFGGGLIYRLEILLGLPILSLARAGDEVRNMLGVEQRKLLVDQMKKGSPSGGQWDVILFSGGGNDIVGNPMALWVKDFANGVTPAKLLNESRFDSALALVRAGYEDLISLRDQYCPNAILFFHSYDFVIPDGRGVCGFGPWLKPTFDLKGFPDEKSASEVLNAMLKRFAMMLDSLARSHSQIKFINTQGTLPFQKSSWHNELHPSKEGFKKVAALFHQEVRTLFPNRIVT